MATVNLYVSTTGNNTTGDSWTNAMTSIQGAIDLITDTVTQEVIIHIEGDYSSPIEYSEDVKIRGIKTVGADASVTIQPGSNSTTTWDNDNYEGADKSPFDSAAASDTWNIKTDTRPVVIKGSVEVTDSAIQIQGIKFDGDSAEGYLKVDRRSMLKAIYCHFYGQKSMAMIYGKSFTHIENSYFEENRVGIFIGGKSWLTLEGDIYIENAWQYGVYVLMDSLVQISPWDEHPLDYFTTEIKTTGARDKYSAIKVIEKSHFKVWNGWEDYDIEVGAVKIYHDYKLISPQYTCIMLESDSLLSGTEKIDFLMKNTKDEDVPIPLANQIALEEDSNCTVVD